MDSMLTFEQLRPALHKWAYHFQDNRFEHWELVNEVWARGNIQKVPHINMASQKVKWEMISYMRDERKGALKKERTKRGEFFPEINNMNYYYRKDLEEDEVYFEETRTKKCYNGYDMKDYFDFLFCGCSRMAKLIVTLKFFEDYSFFDIAKITGDPAAHRTYGVAIKRISIQVKDMEYGRHICKRYYPQTGKEKRKFWIERNREKLNWLARETEAKRKKVAC